MICNVTYYGKTARHLKVRAGWYKHMSALTETRVKKAKNLSLKITALFQGTYILFMVLLGWIMNHANVNAW